MWGGDIVIHNCSYKEFMILSKKAYALCILFTPKGDVIYFSQATSLKKCHEFEQVKKILH